MAVCNTGLLSLTLLLFNVRPFPQTGQAMEWFFMQHTEVDVVPVFSHRRVLCTRLLAFCSHLMLLDGNFPCTGLNACDAAHDFNFFLSPWSLGLHVRLFVCDIFYCLCSSICVLSAF